MGTSYRDFVKYPRTPHLFGSTGTDDDRFLDEQESREFLANESLIIEEKLDGANVAVHFSNEGKLILQCRGHLITEGMHPQFDLFKQWASAKQHVLAEMLGDRFILFGEWLYAKHTIHYQRLPHYFLAFDIFDKTEQVFLANTRRSQILQGKAIHSMPRLHTGPVNKDELKRLITTSPFLGKFENPLTGRTDSLMEGVYLRTEAGGITVGRAKFVRPEFVARSARNTNWRHQVVTPNLLDEGVDIWS